MNRATFERLVRAAQSLRENSHVPFAFEKRVMARLRASSPEDLWNGWLRIMWKAAVGGVVIVALTSALLSKDEEPSVDLLAIDLESTVMASVDTEESW